MRYLTLDGRDAMYDMANLKKLSVLGEGAPEAMKAFWAFDKAALKDGVVPKKYKELMAVAVALTTQCPYCLEIHRAVAVTAGATQEELAETALVAAALRAGAAVTHATHLMGGGRVRGSLCEGKRVSPWSGHDETVARSG
ncbi:carboxymuconolactone decarboxylase family protein [Tunturiibacter empetritectus]|uniref:carboxymuconolactone decarboxylase family protein n=1 Tax=Tunturiibacter empetritectus TaxID=3069691 RepID=UPI003D9AC793